MRPATAEAVREIERLTFFAHVGEPFGSGYYVNVDSWTGAARYAHRADFDRHLQDLSRELGEQITQKDRRRFNATWNEVTAELRRRLDVVAPRAVQAAALPAEHADVVAATLRGCLFAHCLEREYADLVPAERYRELWQIFRAGHFPCGVVPRDYENMLVVF